MGTASAFRSRPVYWTDGRGDERVPVASLGTNGVVDLKVGVIIGKDKQLDLEKGEIGLHSTA